jgi:uncharacterized protein (DUF1697 family)
MKQAPPKTGADICVAFLRGINVGGRNPIKMDALRAVFESLKFRNVKTVLASGNVIFESPRCDKKTVAAKIEKCLEREFGKAIGVMVRSINDLHELAEAEPFKGIRITPQTRLYVSFLPEKPKTKPEIADAHSDKGFRIVYATDYEICTHLELTAGVKSTDLMQYLDREFGRNITTRNWNTVVRILTACGRQS